MEEKEYGPLVMEHFVNPRNVGELQDPSGVGTIRNAVCGDFTRLFLRIEGGRVTAAKFKTFGCGGAIAASSVLTELLRGKTVAEAAAITQRDVIAALGGLPEPKVHCALLAEDALRGALADYQVRTGARTGG